MDQSRECFDFEYYAEHNPDVAKLSNPCRKKYQGDNWLWYHWVNYGQYEGRYSRFRNLIDCQKCHSCHE